MRPAGTAVAPVSLMVYLPPFVHGSQGWPLLQFHLCCSPLSCEACSNGRCSGFAHGVLAPFMHGSLGQLLLLSCSCLLLAWFFYAEVVWVLLLWYDPWVYVSPLCVVHACRFIALLVAVVVALLVARLICTLCCMLRYSLLCSLLCLSAD